MTTKYLLNQTNMSLAKKWLVATERSFIPGTSSMYVLGTRSKLIWDERAIDWPNLTGLVEPMTASEIARTELKREFRDFKRPRWNRTTMQYLFQPPPIYYSGPFEGKAVYIDLKAAYATIYRKLSLTMRFPREMPDTSYLYRLNGVAETLWYLKPARNAVVGIIRSTDCIVQTGTKTKKIYPDNPFLQPHIWLQIQAILHELANWAIKCGAIYISTDGYIFPADWSQWVEFVRTLVANKLGYDFKIGMCEILGWGRYHVEGFKTTQPYQTCRGPIVGQFNAVSDKFKTLRNTEWWSGL